MSGLLLVNPRSGSERPSVDELCDAARELGLDVHALRDGEDPAEVARASRADVLGMAGGDGSLGAVAQVAVERSRGFVCVPFGTRNHFARDVGLNRDDPLSALAGFTGTERLVDVGFVGDRMFLNNVSLGLYAKLVERREHHRRRGAMLARARALSLFLHESRLTELSVDGAAMSIRVMLIANNAYDLDVLSLGERTRLDAGTLHLYAAKGILPTNWETLSPRTAATIDSSSTVLEAAIDGEPVTLRPPFRMRVEPKALRVLLPASLDA